MAVLLHRCTDSWLKVRFHACWRVQKALDEAGIEYTIVKHHLARRKRKEIFDMSGQYLLPVIQLEDGTAYRADSKQMATRIREGRLFELEEKAP